jgi:peroxiredoxin
MRSCRRRWTLWIAALLVVTYVGCGGEPDSGEGPGDPAKQKAPGGLSKAKPATAEKPPAPPTMPEVRLLEAERDTCLLWVDDPMPEAKLPDTEGNEQSLYALAGEKLTVVFFWTSGSSELAALGAQAALEDLQKDVVEPLQDKGVGVIGINEGDTAEVVGQLTGEAKVTFPNLLDSDGGFFTQVATEKLPRLYLLDADKKILWFDLEFSRTTRDKLKQAFQVALGEMEGT